jgi:hypothetical protein
MEGERINIWWLLLSGTAMLTAGWLIPSFPVFMFLGLAPFFAIVDHTTDAENFWVNAEVILIGFGATFFAGFHADTSSIVNVIIHAILFTLPFIAFSFIHESLGPRTGKFIIILLWLGLEYVLLKVQWPTNTLFLADSLRMLPRSFDRWTEATGYLGLSAWVLLANWIFYAATLRGSVNWLLFFLGLGVVIGPLVYSYMGEMRGVTRANMIELYSTDSVLKESYAAKGELVARTCAWVSILILIFAGVKSRTAK